MSIPSPPMSSLDSYRHGTLHTLEEYSFSDEAGQAIRAQHGGIRLAREEDIEAVWKALEQDGHYGLIPVENSSSGLVLNHVDRLIQMPGRIVAEVRHEVRMCAGGIVGSTLEGMTEVDTHPKAQEQSSRFLVALPNLQTRTNAKSTAAGARAVAEKRRADLLALAPKRAIEANGLTVLAEDVANLKGNENVTQMFVVKKNGHAHGPAVDAQFHAAYLVPENKRGILSRITGIIAKANVDLRSIHSRPVSEKRYGFYVEMERQGSESQFYKMTTQLQDNMRREILWLGSWNDTFESGR